MNKFKLLIERPHIFGVSGIRVKVKSIPKCLQYLFWNSSHQGTHSCSHILKFTKHMLSITNEVDPLFFHCVHAYFHHRYYEATQLVLPLHEEVGKACKKMKIEHQSDEKISWEGVKIGKIGFRAASIRTQASVCIHRDSTCVRRLNHVFM